MIGVLFDGLAYGSLLFLVSLGLSVQMGLMNFVNLAHGAFAMAGGFVCVVLMTRLGVPFLATLPVAFGAAALAGAILERLLYRRLYGASPLDQVLFSIGLTFMSIATATWIFGSAQQPVRLPAFLRGQLHLAGADFGIYRIFLLALVASLTAGPRGARRAHPLRSAGARGRGQSAPPQRGLGIDVDRVFTLAFALGSGLAGLGGALGIEVLGLDPAFPLRYMVYFLLVVVVGGAGTLAGPLAGGA